LAGSEIADRAGAGLVPGAQQAHAGAIEGRDRGGERPLPGAPALRRSARGRLRYPDEVLEAPIALGEEERRRMKRVRPV